MKEWMIPSPVIDNQGNQRQIWFQIVIHFKLNRHMNISLIVDIFNRVIMQGLLYTAINPWKLIANMVWIDIVGVLIVNKIYFLLESYYSLALQNDKVDVIGME